MGLELIRGRQFPCLLCQMGARSKPQHRRAHPLIEGFRPEVKAQIPLIILIVERFRLGFQPLDKYGGEREGADCEHRQPEQREAD